MSTPEFPIGGKIERLIPADVVSMTASAEARRLALTKRWDRSYVSAEIQTPLLVIGPTEDENYYLVDFRTGGRSTGRMILNATDGLLEETAGLRIDQDALAPCAMPAELPHLISQRDVTFPDGTFVKLDSSTFSVDATLVWTSCDQSHSPLQPFYVVRQASRVIYVRVDGEIFPYLSITAAGA